MRAAFHLACLEAASKKLSAAKTAAESNDAVIRAAQDELDSARRVDAERRVEENREHVASLRAKARQAVTAYETRLTEFNRAFAAARDALLSLGSETGEFSLRHDRILDALLTVTADQIAARWTGPQYVAIWESATDRHARFGEQSLAEKFAASLSNVE